MLFAITLPVNGGLFRTGASVAIAAQAFDPDGDLNSLRVFLDGTLLVNTTGTVYNTTIQAPAPGGHRVSVEAEDAFGHRTRMESVFTVISNLIPVVNLITPQGQTYPPGASVLLMASAADPDGSVARVQFYVRQHMRFDTPEISVGTDLTSPYTATATNLPSGHYLAYAVATDNEGAKGFSSTGHFMVAPATPIPDITIRFETFSGARVITLEWDNPGAVLERAAKVTGPWQSLSGAASPYPLEPGAGPEFYRLRLSGSGQNQ